MTMRTLPVMIIQQILGDINCVDLILGIRILWPTGELFQGLFMCVYAKEKKTNNKLFRLMIPCKKT